jgi:hypothetical protein
MDEGLEERGGTPIEEKVGRKKRSMKLEVGREFPYHELAWKVAESCLSTLCTKWPTAVSASSTLSPILTL